MSSIYSTPAPNTTNKLEEQLILETEALGTQCPFEIFCTQENSNEIYNIPETYFSFPKKNIMDVEFNEIHAKNSQNAMIPNSCPIEDEECDLDMIFNSEFLSNDEKFDDDDKLIFNDFSDFDDGHQNNSIEKDKKIFDVQLNKKISKAKTCGSNHKTTQNQNRAGKLKISSFLHKNRVNKRAIKAKNNQKLENFQLKDKKSISYEKLALKTTQTHISPFQYEQTQFSVEDDTTAPTTRKSSKDTNFQFQMKSPQNKNVTIFNFESEDSKNLKKKKLPKISHKSKFMKTKNRDFFKGKSSKKNLGKFFDEFSQRENIGLTTQLSFSLAKSRSMNSDAGSVCSNLFSNIQRMFGKVEEKEIKYLQKVEEVKMRKLSNLLNF